MKKIMLFFLLLPYNLYACAYAVMDSDTGRILSSQGLNDKNLIASTTKIMTAIIAIEYGNLYDTYIVGDEINEVYGSMVYIKKSEKLTLEDLLYGLLLRSGNDAAMVISNNVTTYDNFISLMNLKALSLGMYNTSFSNPHGLDDDNQNYSTVKDLAIMMKYAMENETFRKITGTTKYKTHTNLNNYLWYNKNDLLNIYKYSTGGKIGYTTKSGHIFVSSASKNNENLIVSTIKCSDRFNIHKSLYEKTFNKYERYKILDKYIFNVKSNYYKDNYIYIKDDVYLLLNSEEKNNISININIFKDKIIDEETLIGYVNILIKDKIIYKEKIYASNKKVKLNKIKSLLYFWKN